MTDIADAQPNRWRRRLVRLLAAAWLAAFVATHLPEDNIPTTHVGDKTLHTVGYFILGGIFLATLAAYGLGRIRRVGIAASVLAAYGAVDELTQELVPGRHASLRDWLADMFGVLLALAACELSLALLKRRRRRPQP